MGEGIGGFIVAKENAEVFDRGEGVGERVGARETVGLP